MHTKLRALLITFIISVSAHAQIGHKMNLSLSARLTDKSKLDETISLLVKGEDKEVKSVVEMLGGTYKYAAGDISAIRLRLGSVEKLASSEFVSRIEDCHSHYQVFNDTVQININSLAVQQGWAPLPQAYDGTGVIIGIIDTGIDFTHHDFKDINGKTRLKYLWDQRSLFGGTTPIPYGYGQEWDSTEIDFNLCLSNDNNNNSHGTIVSGIAAGNGLEINQYAGVAPKADLIVVAFDFNAQTSNNFTDAVEYIYTKALQLGKPCVINASLGDFFGPHDGRDLESQAVSNLVTAQPGRALIAAAGNFGNLHYHLGYNASTTDTNFTWLKKYIFSNSIDMDIWGDSMALNNIHFSVEAYDSANYASRGTVPFHSFTSTYSTTLTDTMRNAQNDRIAYINYSGSSYQTDDILHLSITPDSSSYYYALRITGTGRFDVWCSEIVANSLLPDSTMFPPMVHYKYGDTQETMAGGFACNDHVISVGSYGNRAHYIDYNNTIQLATFSAGSLQDATSHGPTRDGRIKPDITAPGLWVIAPMVLGAEATSIINSQSWKVAAGGKHILASGTSMASPVVAGIAALYFQANPTGTAAQFKTCLLNNAKSDSFTGTILPNNDWGKGKVDALRTVMCGLVGIDEPLTNINFLNIFPNPSYSGTNIEYYTNDNSIDHAEILIYDGVGKIVKSIELSNNSGTISLKENDMQKGIYFCVLQKDGKYLGGKKLVIL